MSSGSGYYLALRRTQGTIRADKQDWNPWVEFFQRSLQRQKQRLERKIERERILRDDLPELSIAILELARERGRVTVMDAAKVTGASRNTVKDPSARIKLAGASSPSWSRPRYLVRPELTKENDRRTASV